MPMGPPQPRPLSRGAAMAAIALLTIFGLLATNINFVGQSGPVLVGWVVLWIAFYWSVRLLWGWTFLFAFPVCCLTGFDLWFNSGVRVQHIVNRWLAGGP